MTGTESGGGLWLELKLVCLMLVCADIRFELCHCSFSTVTFLCRLSTPSLTVIGFTSSQTLTENQLACHHLLMTCSAHPFHAVIYCLAPECLTKIHMYGMGRPVQATTVLYGVLFGFKKKPIYQLTPFLGGSLQCRRKWLEIDLLIESRWEMLLLLQACTCLEHLPTLSLNF